MENSGRRCDDLDDPGFGGLAAVHVHAGGDAKPAVWERRRKRGALVAQHARGGVRVEVAGWPVRVKVRVS